MAKQGLPWQRQATEMTRYARAATELQGATRRSRGIAKNRGEQKRIRIAEQGWAGRGDGIAQLREGTDERRSAGYEQQRQGMAVKGAKRSGKATSAPRRKGKACQSIEMAWQS